MSDIRSKEYFDDRVYWATIAGIKHMIISVTTKLGIESKPFLYRWYADLGWQNARKRLNEAGKHGNDVHHAMQCLLNGGAVGYLPEIPTQDEIDYIDEIKKENKRHWIVRDQNEMVDIVKLQEFFKLTNPIVLGSEEKVFSVTRNIAGTLDARFLFEKGKYELPGAKKPVLILDIPETGEYICDLKTGNVIDRVWEQIAPYTKAAEEVNQTRPKGGICLHTKSSKRTGIKGFSSEVKTYEELEFHYERYEKLAAAWDCTHPNFAPKIFNFPTMVKLDLKNTMQGENK